MKSTAKASFKILMSMVIFGTLAPFVRRIGVSSAELALYRAAMAAALVGIFLLGKGKAGSLRVPPRELLRLILSGVAMGFNWILLFEAYRYTTVSVATLSYYFAPVIVTALCPVLFREKLGKKQILCFVMSTVGLILITVSGNMTGGGKDLIGIGFGLGAAVLYASVVLLNKSIRTVQGLQRTFLQFVAAVPVLLIYVCLTSGFSLGSLDAIGWGSLLIVGLVHTGLAYMLYFGALPHVPGQKAAILSYVDPLVAVLISVTVLQEPMLPLQIVGGILILGFTAWNELSQ